MNSQRMLAASVLLAGVGLSILAGWYVGRHNQRAESEQVALQADSASYAVRVALDRVAIAVHAVRAFYAADWVTPEGFDRFSRTLALSAATRSLSFYRRVTREGRRRYEARFRAEPARTLGIWQFGKYGEPVRAADEPILFALESTTLLSGREPAYGFNIASLPDRRGPILAAIRQGEVVASEAVELWETSSEGVLLYVPVRDRSGEVVGIAAASIGLQELANVARRASGASDITVAVDATQPQEDSDSAETLNTRGFTFGNRSWTVVAGAIPGGSAFGNVNVLLVVGAGLATTAALVAYLSNRAKTAEVVDARARLRGMLDGLGPLAWLLARDGTIVNANKAAIAAFGRAKANGLGKPFWDLPFGDSVLHQTDRIRKAVSSAAGGEDVRFDLQFEDDNGRNVLDLWIRPLASAYGKPNHLVASAVDVTDRYESEETQRLLTRELDHRMKNTLQIIQAIVRRTARSHSTVDGFENSLLGRVNAMSRAHELLAQEHWLGAEIGTVVRQETSNFDPGDAVHTSGPIVRLSPKAALSLAMVVYELGTNASKYGALTSVGGRIAVEWRVDRSEEPQLVLRWQESGGPQVTPPQRRGFGSMLIERSIAYELDGKTTLEYRQEGLVCTICAPMRTLRPFVAEPRESAETGAAQ